MTQKAKEVKDTRKPKPKAKAKRKEKLTKNKKKFCALLHKALESIVKITNVKTETEIKFCV